MLQAQKYQFSRHWHCSIADSLYFNSTVTVLSQYCHSTVYSTVYSTVSFFATHSHDQEKFASLELIFLLQNAHAVDLLVKNETVL